MSDSNAVDDFRTAYENLVREVGEDAALAALEDLREDARDAQLRGEPFVEVEDGSFVEDHEFDGQNLRYVEEQDGVLVDVDGNNARQDLVGYVFLVDVEDGRLVLDGDTYEAKDHIKAVGRSHYDFDGDRKLWLVDEEVIEDLHQGLNAAGFMFADDRGSDEEDEGPDAEERLRAILDDVEEGDRIRVEYEQKNGEGSNDKEGVVRETRLPEEEEFAEVPVLRFQRDDDQRMYVKPDDYGKLALYTAMSHAPFVGDVEDVEVLAEVEA